MRRLLELNHRGGMILIGQRELFPTGFAKYQTPISTPGLILAIGSSATLKEQLRSGWGTLRMPRIEAGATPERLLIELERAIGHGRLMMMFAPGDSDVPTPREEGLAGDERPFRLWSQGDKLAYVLRRAVPHAGETVRADLEALLAPANIAASVGMILALAASHAVGVGVAVDAVLVTYAYYEAQLAGIRAIGDIISATARTLDARERDDLEPLAVLVGRALALLGGFFLRRFLRRITTKGGGGAGSETVRDGHEMATARATDQRAGPSSRAVPDASPSARRHETAKPKPARTVHPTLTSEEVIARQRGKSVEQLHAAAVGNQQRLADTGRLIEKQVGVSFKDPGVKSLERTREKIANEGYADPAEIKDLSRGAFTVRDQKQADAIVAKLREQYPVYDKGWKRLDSGYVDRKVIVQYPDGGVGEIQIVPESIWQYKVGDGHILYERQRTATSASEAKALERTAKQAYDKLLEGSSFSAD